LVEEGFKENRNLIVLASKSKQPSDTDFGNTVIKPLANVLQKLTSYKDSRRGSDFYNHEYAVAEGIQCLAWVTVPKTPVAYTKEMVNSAQFYNNKVLVAYKQKDKRHVAFVDQFKQLIEELANYIKEHHTTGLKWNTKGGDWQSASTGSASTQSAPAPKGPPGPPPPGPPPPPPVEVGNSSGGASNPDLFASINQLRDKAGDGLRRVKDEEKSKNRSKDEKVHTVPLGTNASATTAKSSTVGGKKPTGPPKFELVQGMGEKWLIENQVGKHDLVISETLPKQGVYILNCKDILVTIKGKVNGIIIDSCAKTAVIFDDAVSSVEMVNSTGIKVQVNGNVPTINVDKTDGVQIFLSKQSISANVITSKSSEMNLCIPNTAGDDYDEIVIPEQFESKWNTQTKKLVTQMVTLNL
jgi:adenylyl cyclase-associated protein